MTAESEGLQLSSGSGRWVLTATVLGSGMAMIDGTVVNVALPHISRELGGGFAALQWVINGYALTLASLILLGGSLGDKFGRRRVFLIGVAWFALASVGCGLAPNMETLIAARALQGVGGALLTPGSLALISSSFRREDRGAAIGAWSGLGGLAAALGPLLGGFLAEQTWRAVFLINVPIAVLVAVVTVLKVPESRNQYAPPGLDVTGTTLAVIGLAATTFGLTDLSNNGMSPGALIAVAAGIAAFVGLIAVERRSSAPLVPPALFTDNIFRIANLITLLIYGALGVVFLLLVLQLQTVAGFSPVAAGSALLPFTAVMLLFSAKAGALAGRRGPRLPLAVGAAIAAIGVLLMLRVGADASWLADVFPAAVTFGMGMTLIVAPLTSAVLGAAPDDLAGAASGVNNAVARAGGLIAVAVVPGLAGIAHAEHVDPGAFDAGFRTAIMIAAGLLLASSVLAILGIRPRTALATRSDGFRIEDCPRCDVTGPAVAPSEVVRQLP